MSNRRMKIGVVCYPSFGGSGVIATEIALGMARRGHEVHLISTAPPARFHGGKNAFFHGVHVPRYPLFEHAPYSLALASKMIEISRAARLDLMHTHYAVPHAVAAHLARQVLTENPPRILATLHGTDVRPIGSNPGLRPVVRLALLHCDAITVPSAHLRSEVYPALDLPSSVEVQVIPNFVDTEHFKPAQSREPLSDRLGLPTDDSLPLLTHISNFRPLKRALDVVKIYARVAAVRPARLLMVGDGPERPRAEQRLRELGLEKRALFVGNRGDVADLLRCSDLMLVPSESESFGLAALEALSCGVPVVAARVGGLEGLIEHGNSGFLAPWGDIEAMAAGVLELLADPQRLAAFRTAARVSVERRWQAEPILDQYEACYRRALETKRPGVANAT